MKKSENRKNFYVNKYPLRANESLPSLTMSPRELARDHCSCSCLAEVARSFWRVDMKADLENDFLDVGMGSKIINVSVNL